MDERKEAKAAERAELEAEGRRIRAALEEERALLEAVKQLKLKELEASGVARKYQSQLETFAPVPARPRAAK